MNNLKKVLSLGLASSMLMGMMVVGAGAATYTDADEINNTQAVEVMSAVGVFSGTDAGDFQPQGDLTRETAAKIITYMLMGKTAADKLSTTAAPFKDVAANRWSAGSIAYCVNMGIIAGDGNGNFYPTQTVNGYAFAKMLLVALGYDPKIEGFTGSNWAISVSKLALNIGLDAGTDVSLANTLTREQACQMAFNTLKADLVEYANKGTEITTSDGTNIVVGASAASSVVNNKNDYRVNGTLATTDDHAKQFVEQYFNKVTAYGSTDELGRPATKWTNDTTVIGTYADKATLTYTTAVNPDDMADNLKAYTNATANTSKTDGVADTTGNITTATFAADIAGLTGNGVQVDIYTTGTEITGVYVTNTYLDQVTNVDTDKDGRYIEVTDGKFYTEAFAEDDYVIYTKGVKSGSTSVLTVAAAESVTGTLTSYTAGKKLVVGGTTYEYNADKATAVSATVSGFTLKSDVTVYLDAFGYVVGAELSKAASSNYAYVEVMQQSFNVWSAKLIFTDGTSAIVETDETSNALQGKLVTYVSDSKDVYSLSDKTDVTDSGSKAVVTKKGSVSVSLNGTAYVANSKTTFVVKTENGTTVYTGYTNVPTISGTATALAATLKNGALSVVYLNVAATDVSDAATKTIFVAYDANTKATTDEKGTYYTYNAVIDGEITTIDIIDSYCGTTLTASGVFSGSTVNTKGIVTALTAIGAYSVDGSGNITAGKIVETDNGATSGTGSALAAKAANGVIVVGGISYAYGDDVVVYNISAQGKFTKTSITSLRVTETGETITLNINNKGVVTAVFVERV